MKRGARDALKVFRDVCGAHGVSVELVQGGVHPHIIARTAAGGWTKVPFSSSPRGDATSHLNIQRQAAHRALRDLGIDGGRGAHPSPTGPARDPWSAIAHLAVPSPAQIEELPMAAEEPRKPTREELRRVIEALDEHYLPDSGCYIQSFSDASLAEKLNLPRAWISAERERLFGPDACEADGQLVEGMNELIGRARAVEDRAMALAQDAEALRRDVDKALTKVVKKARAA